LSLSQTWHVSDSTVLGRQCCSVVDTSLIARADDLSCQPQWRLRLGL